MSVKIYQGFRFVGTAGQLRGNVELFRPWITSQAEERLDAFVQVFVDGGRTEGEGLTSWMNQRAAMKASGQRNPIVDTDFSITVFPEMESIAQTWLGIAFTEHPGWYAEWMKLPYLSDYAYWNNTDRPKAIRPEDWDERSRSWDRVLFERGERGGIPSMCGFSIDVMHPSGPLPKLWRRPDVGAGSAPVQLSEAPERRIQLEPEAEPVRVETLMGVPIVYTEFAQWAARKTQEPEPE